MKSMGYDRIRILGGYCRILVIVGGSNLTGIAHFQLINTCLPCKRKALLNLLHVLSRAHRPDSLQCTRIKVSLTFGFSFILAPHCFRPALWNFLHANQIVE